MANIAKYIDQTLLSQDATGENVVNFCRQAKEYGFYAVCIQPCRVATAREALEQGVAPLRQDFEGQAAPCSRCDVRIVAVVGFPLGATYTEVKALEAKKCLEDGADEIDMVMNIGALRQGDTALVEADIKALAEVVHAYKAILKVIIETGLLTDEEKRLACRIAADAGADFVKTSTGVAKGSKPATIEDVRLMCEAIGDLGVKVKASGGIKDYETAMSMLTAGADRIGTSSGVQIVMQEAAEKV